MTTITIPPEALEAMFKVLYPYMDTGGSEKMAREVCEDAFLAMIEAWPGMWNEQENGSKVLFDGTPNLILPLTETPDDKA